MKLIFRVLNDKRQHFSFLILILKAPYAYVYIYVYIYIYIYMHARIEAYGGAFVHVEADQSAWDA